MKNKQTSKKEIAAALIVVNAAIAELAEAGGPVTSTWHRSLGLVEAWLRGEPIRKKDLVAAEKILFRISNRHSDKRVDPLEKKAGWLSDAAGKIIASASSGKNYIDLAMTHTSYGMFGDDYRVRARECRARFEAALRVASDREVESTALPEPKRRVDARAAAALASVIKIVDAPIAALFRRKKAHRNPKQTASRADVAALLAKRGFAAHANVLDFEARYGGLIVPESGDDDWLDEGTYATFGAFAFFKSEKPGKRDDDLVPIVSDSRGTCYMDAKGRAFGEDEVEGMMDGVFAKDGDALVARLTLSSFYEEKLSRRRFRALPKKSGARAAKVVQAKRVASVSTAGDVWWASEAFIVHETRKETEICALDDESAKKLQQLKRRI